MLSSAELELEGAQCRGERAIGPLWLRVQGRRFGVVFFEAGFGVRASIFFGRRFGKCLWNVVVKSKCLWEVSWER